MRRVMFLWCAVFALVIGAVALRITNVDAAPGGGKAATTASYEIDDDCLITGCGSGGGNGTVGDDCAGDCGDVGDDCAGNCGDVGDDAAGDVSGDVGDDCAGDCDNGAGDDCAGDCGGDDGKCPCPSAKPSAAPSAKPSAAPSAKPSDDGKDDGDNGDNGDDDDGDDVGGTTVSTLPDTGTGSTGVLESTTASNWLLLTAGLLALGGIGYAVRRRTA